MMEIEERKRVKQVLTEKSRIAVRYVHILYCDRRYYVDALPFVERADCRQHICGAFILGDFLHFLHK